MQKVLVGGCFNKIHEGHIYFLKEARKLGDYLVVVLAHDANNKKPYAIPAKQRKKNMEKTKLADKVVIGDKRDMLKVVRKEKPNIVALGYDQTLSRNMSRKLKEMKVKIVRIKRYSSYKTKKLMPISFTKH
ncbi:MAG: adenylyltransferase/cytidyltransferase family protein [Candidatus Aenigmarchaeota archaeon]|nr:adenylyltransferase/cytidyltransferase family protein [Candidatus Aenigmarchaeota archaeon]